MPWEKLEPSRTGRSPIPYNHVGVAKNGDICVPKEVLAALGAVVNKKTRADIYVDTEKRLVAVWLHLDGGRAAILLPSESVRISAYRAIQDTGMQPGRYPARIEGDKIVFAPAFREKEI